jgi:hypothetical protein
MMRKLILFAAVGVVAACGSAANDSGSPDSGTGRTGPAQFNLTINTSGNGAVRGAGADCRGSCTTQAPSGQQFHLVAVPDSGATFTGWSGACSGAGGCDLTLMFHVMKGVQLEIWQKDFEYIAKNTGAAIGPRSIIEGTWQWSQPYVLRAWAAGGPSP